MKIHKNTIKFGILILIYNIFLFLATTEEPTTKKPKKIKEGNKEKSKERDVQDGGDRDDEEKGEKNTTPIVGFYPYVVSIYQQLIQATHFQPQFFQAVQNPSNKDKPYELLPIVNNSPSINPSLFNFNVPSLLQLLGLSPQNYEIIIKPKIEEPSKEVEMSQTSDKANINDEDDIVPTTDN